MGRRCRRELNLGRVLSFKPSGTVQKRSRGSILKKKGSNKLYIEFRYYGVKVEKSTGLNDTLENRLKVEKLLDTIFAKVDQGTFVFAEAFPGASEKDKRFFVEKEGLDYSPEPRNTLFADYAKRWVDEILD